MSTVSLPIQRPHPCQAMILSEARRFNILACGRRFGKTTFGLERLLRPMLAGYPTAWFAPTYKFLTEVWRDFTKLLAPVVRDVSKQERRIELVTGGTIEFWSLEDPDAGRSRKYKHVVIDEAAKVKTLEQSWNEAIRATLTDYRGGADFYSTPKGRNFFWQLWTKGQDPHETEWKSWQQPTSANPYIHPDEIEAARLQLPERVFRQEFLAEFLEESAGVFRGVGAAVDKGRSLPDPPQPGWFYSNGADLARVEDFTVFSSLDHTGRQVFWDRFNQISWERQVGSLKAHTGLYPGTVHLDTTGIGDPIHGRLTAEGVNVTPFHFTNASKNALIDHLAMGIEQGKIRLMDLPEQTNELLAFEYELTPSRNIRMGAPPGMHDDCVIALALSYWGFANQQPAGAALPPGVIAPVPLVTNPWDAIPQWQGY